MNSNLRVRVINIQIGIQESILSCLLNKSQFRIILLGVDASNIDLKFLKSKKIIYRGSILEVTIFWKYIYIHMHQRQLEFNCLAYALFDLMC